MKKKRRAPATSYVVNAELVVMLYRCVEELQKVTDRVNRIAALINISPKRKQ